MVVAEAVDVVVVAVAVDVAAVAAEAAVAAVAVAAVAAAAVVSEAAAYRGASAVFADPRRALLGIDKRRFFWPGSGSDPANSSHHWDRRARTAELADNSRSITNTCGTGNGIAVVGRTTTAQKASASAANCVKEVEASPEGQIVYARLANDDTDTSAKLSDQKPLTKKNEQDALVCRTRFFQIAGRYTLKLLARLRRGAGAGPGSSWFNALNMAMRAIISMPPASAAEIRNSMATCQCSRSAGDSARM
jgi:hypothetical protein